MAAMSQVRWLLPARRVRGGTLGRTHRGPTNLLLWAALLAGTSACSNGEFYCPNLGAVPVVLNSSMVDDGICGKAA